MSVGPFCEKFVEATGKEAGLVQVIYINALTHSVSDHVQITALCRVLRLDVKVAYLDGRDDTGTVDFVEFQNEQAAKEPITLLYRYALHCPFYTTEIFNQFVYQAGPLRYPDQKPYLMIMMYLV